MRLFKWIPALLAGMAMMALSQSVQAQFTVVITDVDNGDSITKSGISSGGTTTLDFGPVDGGSKFVVTTTLFQSVATGDSIVAAFTTTTGTGSSSGDTYAIAIKDATVLTNLSGPGTLTASIATASSFSSLDTINNKATYKGATTITTNSTTDASGPNQTPTPTTKSIANISSFTLSEISTFQAASSGATDKWTATANVSEVHAVPEPTGVLIGLVGLPCLGAVVFFSRRRFAGMASLVA